MKNGSKFVYMKELYIFGVHTYNKFARWYNVSAHLLHPVKTKILITFLYKLSIYFHITCRAAHAQIVRVHKGGGVMGGDVTICP